MAHLHIAVTYGWHHVPIIIPSLMVQLSCCYVIWFRRYGVFMLYLINILSLILYMWPNVFCSVSRSDTISDVRFALALTVQKLADRRIRPFVPLRGHSNGGGPHGLFP